VEQGEGPTRAHWEDVWSRRAEDEVSWFELRPATSLRLVTRTVGPDARLVDVGGGASRLVDGLLGAGFERISVLDIAGPALERAKQRLGGRASAVAWICADVTSWRPEHAFDLWHDRAVFHFMVRPEDRAAYLATLRRALRSGGHAIIGTFASDGPERCSGLPVRRYEPETLAAELGTGFRLLDGLHEEHVTPAGKVQRFQFSRLARA